MRLTHLVAAVLPFVLLLALLTSVVASPRIHSNNVVSSSPKPAATHIPTLAPVRVTAADAELTDTNTDTLHFVGTTRTRIRTNLPWMHNTLWMPYFSFAMPAAASRGL